MSTFLSKNPVITSAVAQNMNIEFATIGNLTVTEGINANIAVGNLKNLSLQDLTTANLVITNNLSVVANSVFNGSALFTGQVACGLLTASRGVVGNVDITNGNVVAGYVSGNGSGLTSIINSALPRTITSDIIGNVMSSFANVLSGIFGNVVSGNISAGYLYGNGSGITNIVNSALPWTIMRDLVGNIIASTANVVSGVFGNVVSGNIYAGYLYGNGSGITNIVNSALPWTIMRDLVGNISGSSANVVSGVFGNVVSGNITTGYISGNGSGLTSVVNTALPRVITSDIIGNISGLSANIQNGVFGNVVSGNIIVSGNITTGYVSGNGSGLTNIVASSLVANVGKITGHYCVSMNGNDTTADGSENRPFRTIQAAHDRALAELPPTGGSISNQAQILVYPGVYTGTSNISRFNTIIRGAGSLYGRGQMTSIGLVNVDCPSATSVYNNTVSLENLFVSTGITNTGEGRYILNIDSCYVYGGIVSSGVFTMTNPNSIVYINTSYLSSALPNATYLNANTGIINMMDTTIQTSSGIQNGHLINVGGNCGISMERCYINASGSNNAAIYVSGNATPVSNPFKVTLTNSFLQNTIGPGIDFGTSGAFGYFVRNIFQVANGQHVFAGNGLGYQLSQTCNPTFSNTKAITFPLFPLNSF